MDNGSFETKDELDSEVGGSRDEAVRSRKPSEKPRTAETKSQKRRIYKNVLLVSISFLLLFVAFESMSKLQSSINTVDNLGLWSSVVIYASLILSCLFVPSLVISKLTLKWTMVASILCYSTYIAAQFYPQVRAFRTLIQFTLLTLSQTISHQQLNLTKPTRTSSTLCCQREQWSVLLLLHFGRPSALSSLNLLAGRLLSSSSQVSNLAEVQVGSIGGGGGGRGCDGKILWSLLLLLPVQLHTWQPHKHRSLVNRIGGWSPSHNFAMQPCLVFEVS